MLGGFFTIVEAYVCRGSIVYTQVFGFGRLIPNSGMYAESTDDNALLLANQLMDTERMEGHHETNGMDYFGTLLFLELITQSFQSQYSNLQE